MVGSRLLPAICIGLALPVYGSAFADNAALTTGGLPQMMSAHPSIAMESEVIQLKVYSNRVDTDCNFVFVNHGKACTVNMGFPDFGMFAYATPRKKPVTMFKKFSSFVDGKPVHTELAPGARPGEQWQTKMVPFQANQRRVVQEVYTTDLGGWATDPVIAFASYLLHTGSSWKGNIGQASISFTFMPDSEVQVPLKPEFFATGHQLSGSALKDVKVPGRLIVLGFGEPKVDGRTLEFNRSNWRPEQKDDILVMFAFPKAEMKRLKDAAAKQGS